jgi:menaquinone-dependent protoporphyrinogen oxidase
MLSRITRRGVLIGLGGVLAAGTGLTVLGLRRPSVTPVRLACGEVGTDMKGKILVAYASRAGSTAEVAERVAARLCAHGLAAEAKPVGEVADLSGYSAAVLGSGVYYGSWLSAMTGFAQDHAAELRGMPVALFTLHMQHRGDTPEEQAARAQYTATTRALVAPVDEVFFAGRVDPSRLSLLERLAVRFVGSPVGDFRDWSRIEAWANALPAGLEKE